DHKRTPQAAIQAEIRCFQIFVMYLISDYESLKTVIAPTSGEYERQMNILLDRLGNLLKMKD
ncbi:hypothetical protein AAAU73_20370, partial [Phocaeicola vulgatus]|uniref:hypothetical protein n=1 Tax=Phocaeicola vulgatus TaxID=821 RepID=UPI0032C08D5F